jgi:hypothetical protein
MVGQTSCLSVQARCLHYPIHKRYFSNSHIPYRSEVIKPERGRQLRQAGQLGLFRGVLREGAPASAQRICSAKRTMRSRSSLQEKP